MVLIWGGNDKITGEYINRILKETNLLENDKCKYLKCMSTILKNAVYAILYRSNLVMNKLFIL
ncbi:hypothetical protein [Bacillus sp. DX1.1]|uniref:hypothetical protein n=1 Tax=Bacillus sp. DX1.1 TaxID=3055866 RepID=UPI0025A26BB6|nr:hypothetical protein [Bacillus sp. DX1.1]WJE84452.1 hypothetical protein QRE67_27330 [Bacillus sp. DX3.1]